MLRRGAGGSWPSGACREGDDVYRDIWVCLKIWDPKNVVSLWFSFDFPIKKSTELLNNKKHIPFVGSTARLNIMTSDFVGFPATFVLWLKNQKPQSMSGGRAHISHFGHLFFGSCVEYLGLGSPLGGFHFTA